MHEHNFLLFKLYEILSIGLCNLSILIQATFFAIFLELVFFFFFSFSVSFERKKANSIAYWNYLLNNNSIYDWSEWANEKGELTENEFKR